MGKRCLAHGTHPVGGHANPDPTRGHNPGILFFILITLGQVWQSVVAYIILRREVKPFTWESIKDRLWLYTPSNPKTGVPSNRLYLWMIPLVVLTQAYYWFEVFGWLDELWVKTFSFLAPPPYAVIQDLAEPALGQWWLLGVLAVLFVFNYLVGEELIFRGILLPKINGVFGKWDFRQWHSVLNIPPASALGMAVNAPH